MATDFVKGEVDASGRFQRQKTQFLTPLGSEQGQLPVKKKSATVSSFLMPVPGLIVN